MALFGRRKPGFSKEVELKSGDIPEEFSDALDPAMNRGESSGQEKPEPSDKGEVSPSDPAADVSGEKKPIDLAAYLESLPDPEDPFPPSEEEPVPEEPPRTQAQLLADFIRERAAAGWITPKAYLISEVDELDTLLAEIAADPECADILTVEGHQDIYYYSDLQMAHNFAKIAMLVTEKDIPRTMAELIRFNCEHFPTPTPLSYFTHTPYFYTVEQMESALTRMSQDPEYQDIKRFNAKFNGIPYLYSEKIMSLTYAEALADGIEKGEMDG